MTPTDPEPVSVEPPNRPGRLAPANLVAILVVVLAVVALAALSGASRADAVGEIEEEIVVGPNEVVDKTLIAAAQSIRIEGTVNGDAVLAARRVVISGVVRGNLQVAAEEVEIEADGSIEGSAHSAGEEITIRGHVNRNVYAFGESVTLASTAEIGRDVVAAGSEVRVDGHVGRDLRAYAEDIDVTGSVGRNIAGTAADVALAGSGSVGGDIELSVPEAARVAINPSAQVAGHTQIEENRKLVESKYLQADYYLSEIISLLASFVVGVLLIRFFPQVLSVRLAGAKDALAGLGVGLLLFVATPLAAVFLMFTLIGLPIGLLGLAAYAACLYLSSIVVAARVGRLLLGERRQGNTSLALAIGLVLLAVATELPLLGGWVTFVVLIAGLGMLYRAARDGRRRALEAAPH